jgi:hypothetical protein
MVLEAETKARGGVASPDRDRLFESVVAKPGPHRRAEGEVRRPTEERRQPLLKLDDVEQAEMTSRIGLDQKIDVAFRAQRRRGRASRTGSGA